MFGPGLHDWTLSADFEHAENVSVAGHGRIELTEPQSALAVCARLLVELAGPDLSGLDANVRFTIKPTRGDHR
ncbi:hypothetical protein [Streptomyces tubercidicus]|uniref:hypothetical protein n=2 Tax=Streptomyces TaxID=1883 RepID=UPI0036BCD5E5